MLLDDIASVLDDVAVLTKVAAQKTAGVLGDDLALNAQQVTGVAASREIPVVWAVAKGSLVNKSMLVPAALLLSVLAPWAITPLLIAGGLFLCYEGCEKLVHKFLHAEEEQAHEKQLHSAIADPNVDLVAFEKDRIRGAIRTDFILSAEIIVITLGTVEAAPFSTKVMVLTAIAILMTVGVYGLVASIVKLDDLGTWLLRSSDLDRPLTMKQRIGKAILITAPYLMKTLSVVGTMAMFLVGGGILVHGVPPIHHLIEAIVHPLSELNGIGPVLSSVVGLVLEAVTGLIGGALVLLVVLAAKKAIFSRSTASTH